MNPYPTNATMRVRHAVSLRMGARTIAPALRYDVSFIVMPMRDRHAFVVSPIDQVLRAIHPIKVR
jgi:hypothetical protein